MVFGCRIEVDPDLFNFDVLGIDNINAPKCRCNYELLIESSSIRMNVIQETKNRLLPGSAELKRGQH